MSITQKRIALAVVLIGLAYFILFIFPNALGAKDWSMLQKTSTDEPITYPYVLRMLQDPTSLKDLFVRWVVYGDYHYGWLFYLWSALVLLPLKAIYGMGFVNHIQLNILLLRQLVSVLPMVLAIGLLVYMQTRFKSWLKTLVLLVMLFTIRAIFRMNIQFWHPDALSVLAVVVTLFFLERDRLRFGRNFYFAAAACGVAIGIKLAGLFFFCAIPAYIIAGILKHVLNIKKAVIHAGLFLVVMVVSVFVTNPFLYNQGARADLIKIQTYKSEQLAQAKDYPQDYTADYQKGPEHWSWTFRTFFGSWPMLGFAFISLLASCFWGPNKLLNRLILAYIIPQTIYLFYFVAPKPDQYFVPVMLPMFSAMLNLPEAIKEFLANRPPLTFPRAKLIVPAATLAVAIIVSGFLVANLTRFYSGNITRYTAGLAIEQSEP